MATDISLKHSAHLRARPHKRSITGVQILGTGSYAPAEVVRNEDLAPLGYDPEWIIQRTGIRERRRAAPEEATSDLAYAAARHCLDHAQVSPEELDLILVATMTPDTLTPSTACHLQRRLGSTAAAMDLNAACSGFMYALVTGSQFIKTGAMQRVLVVGADLMSRTVNPEDRKTYPLFGDGAGAVLLGAASDDHGLLSYALGADGSGTDLLCIPGGGSREPLTPETLEAKRQFMYMDGRQVFKWAVRTCADVMRQTMEEAELTIADLDLLVLHQANIRIIDAALEALGVPREKCFVNLDRYGNTSAASIPLALDEARRAGRIHAGDNILMCGFGAGLAWGAGVLRW
ncbi:MAG TPA: beta-ketoacyl-ACP synthase III [Pirellulaceae bacterium]|nr:beta-ketoacyl-ACP synthase III [Pirellulaceae bacterium]